MSKANIFQFKQFAINQTGCAMKVNTDGVLLGALATANDPQTILDIGTGTGVIALMLAQRYSRTLVDAVEINPAAGLASKNNFCDSSFHSRCTCYPVSFEQFFDENPEKKYDLIVSNPPFFIDSLRSVDKSKEMARHTTMDFFTTLFLYVARSLTPTGRLSLILPVETADAVKRIAAAKDLYLQEEISIASFKDSRPHRKIVTFGRIKTDVNIDTVVIYSSIGNYTGQYAGLLKDFLTIF